MDAPSQPKFSHTYAECLFAEEQHHELDKSFRDRFS